MGGTMLQGQCLHYIIAINSLLLGTCYAPLGTISELNEAVAMRSALLFGRCTGSVSGLKSEAQFWARLWPTLYISKQIAFDIPLLKINRQVEI